MNRRDWNPNSGGGGNWGAWAGLFGGRWGRFFGAGELRVAILSLLGEGPKHGYQLIKEMQERSGGAYKASAGSVYPTLQQLEDELLIVSDRQEGRRVYSLTTAGQAELDRESDVAGRIWSRAEDWQDSGPWTGASSLRAAGAAELLKSTVKAVRWAKRHPQREERLRAMLNKFSEELDELSRHP